MIARGEQRFTGLTMNVTSVMPEHRPTVKQYRGWLHNEYTESARDQRWSRVALTAAASSRHGSQMSAIAVQGGRVVSTSVNRRRNDPTTVSWQHCSFHAEEGLVRQRANLVGATVYVARLTRAGTAGMARPCLRCFLLLAGAGVRRVVWTAPKEELGTEDCTTCCQTYRDQH